MRLVVLAARGVGVRVWQVRLRCLRKQTRVMNDAGMPAAVRFAMTSHASVGAVQKLGREVLALLAGASAKGAAQPQPHHAGARERQQQVAADRHGGAGSAAGSASMYTLYAQQAAAAQRSSAAKAFPKGVPARALLELEC